MSNFEIFTLALSSCAIVISVFAICGQRTTNKAQNKLQRESNDLQRSTALLAEKQLEIIQKDSGEKAKLRLDLVRKDEYRSFIYITNVSSVIAKNVYFDLVIHDQNSTPLIPDEVNRNLPKDSLGPGEKITLQVNLYRDGPRSFPAILKWTNPNGDKESYETYASLYKDN